MISFKCCFQGKGLPGPPVSNEILFQKKRFKLLYKRWIWSPAGWQLCGPFLCIHTLMQLITAVDSRQSSLGIAGSGHFWSSSFGSAGSQSASELSQHVAMLIENSMGRWSKKKEVHWQTSWWVRGWQFSGWLDKWIQPDCLPLGFGSYPRSPRCKTFYSVQQGPPGPSGLPGGNGFRGPPVSFSHLSNMP